VYQGEWCGTADEATPSVAVMEADEIVKFCLEALRSGRVAAKQRQLA
jgi:hypothetical protein